MIRHIWAASFERRPAFLRAHIEPLGADALTTADDPIGFRKPLTSRQRVTCLIRPLFLTRCRMLSFRFAYSITNVGILLLTWALPCHAQLATPTPTSTSAGSPARIPTPSPTPTATPIVFSPQTLSDLKQLQQAALGSDY